MIKLFSLKQEKEKEAANAAAGGEKKVAPGLIRMQKDVSEIKDSRGIKVEFPDKEDIMNFKINILPFDGLYKDGTFVFDVKVPKSYPHDPPKVLCETTVYHPNIDMEGHVCLNILREDWKPVLTINSVIMGLQFLMLEPNADDPLNKEAANQMTSNYQGFTRDVDRSMRGQSLTIGQKRYSFTAFR